MLTIVGILTFRPIKKIPMFPVPRPTLSIRGQLNFFFKKKIRFLYHKFARKLTEMDKSE